jgi:tetrahydromethanopterin S-methyltransferase subunit B
MDEHEESQRKEYQELLVQMTSINGQMTRLVCDVADLRTQLKNDYVHRREFVPVRNIVYGAVALILTAVFGALIALVVIQAP